MSRGITKWLPVEEMDLDNGEHTCYSRVYGDRQRIWVTQMPDKSWHVEVPCPEDNTDVYVIAKSKSLHGAKRAALRYIRQITN